MPNTTTIRRAERNSYGDIVNEELIDIKCKLEYEFNKITNNQGNEVVSAGSLRTNFELNRDDEVLVNDEYRRFIQVQPQDDFQGKIVYWIGWF